MIKKGMVINMSRVCVFFAEGYEEIEALTVVDLLRRAGMTVDMVSVTGRRNVRSSHGINVETDKLFGEVDFDDVNMLILPGGMPGTKNLEAYEPLMEKVDSFFHTGKYVCAICAAPSILGHRGILKGKRACSFPEFETHLEGAKVTENAVETDGNIITGRGMGCSVDFGLAIVEALSTREQAAALSDKIVYSHFKG